MSVTGPVLVAYTGDMSVLHFTQEPAITKAPKKRRVRKSAKHTALVNPFRHINETAQPTAQSGKGTHREMCNKAHRIAIKYFGTYGEVQKTDQPMFKGTERNHRRQLTIQIGSVKIKEAN